jgi:hypothetical protein
VLVGIKPKFETIFQFPFSSFGFRKAADAQILDSKLARTGYWWASAANFEFRFSNFGFFWLRFFLDTRNAALL